ncbi:ABC transporter ATP-binding protein [Enterovirga sp.]|uniref:ABC transporter ATP-binding protein n=1 Tax=Enterovirga sp. TaxID=2026350 RepID=UPI0026123179|nr:ABC transporter ATP-binding protein [Enterovirga sp.]MDB5592887.1 branched-chain amino acid transporter ATP-binding protein [Enterovirga sp.]
MTASASLPPLLETQGLSKSFGALVVADSIDLTLRPGARHALIGPNGAGKTTFVNLVTGTLQPTAGRILMGGEEVTGLSPEARVRKGVGRTFQINSLFNRLSVLENVAIAVSERDGFAGRIFRARKAERRAFEEAYAILEGIGIGMEALRPVAEIAYGRQRLVEIAIALALKPKVLLLDEPAAGIPSAESHVVLDVVEALPPDIAVLIIEHDMALVFRLASRITVLVQGAILVEGTPQEIAHDPKVKEVYLGEKSH